MSSTCAGISSAQGSQGTVQQRFFSTLVVECRVCHDNFACQGLHVPRLLTCGHTLCHSCLCQLSSQATTGTISCPFDRQITQLGENGVWGLRKNFALTEFMERLQQQRVRQSTSPVMVCEADTERQVDECAVRAVDNTPQAVVPCDEDDSHAAVIYCVVCETHLCENCSESTHRTRTLSKHRRVPLSEKPAPRPKCTFHSAYALEFVCLDPECCATEAGGRLMCLLCRDYGRHSGHKHALLEPEASRLRQRMSGALGECRELPDECEEWVERIARTVYEIERVEGAGDNAKRQVRKHFSDLRHLLSVQETAALTVVDTHVHERLTGLRLHQEELTALAYQIACIGAQLEKNLSVDNAKLVDLQKDSDSMVDAVTKHKDQVQSLPQELNLETRVPISFTKDNRVHVGPKIEMRVVTLGLDDAGKTTILFKLKQNELVSTVPTIGFNVETIEYKNLKLTIWDVGGLPKLRPLWKHYYLNTQALIFVIDSCDRDRLAEVQSELVKLLSENELRDASLLIFANKQDVDLCMSVDELVTALTLSKLCYGRSWYLQPCDALNGHGLWEGVEWLTRQLVSTAASPVDYAS